MLTIKKGETKIPTVEEVLTVINDESARVGIFVDLENTWKEVYRLERKANIAIEQLNELGVFSQNSFESASERMKTYAVNSKVNHLLDATPGGDISLGKDSIENFLVKAKLENVDPTIIKAFELYSTIDYNKRMISTLKGKKDTLGNYTGYVAAVKTPFLTYDLHKMGALHPVYAGQNSGRFGATKPAIGNIDRDLVDKILTAPLGYYFCNVDMGQVDPKFYANLILKDPDLNTLINAYNDAYYGYYHFCKLRDGDPKFATFTPVELDESFKENRKAVKVLVNGMNYGKMPSNSDPTSIIFNKYIVNHPNSILLHDKIKAAFARGQYLVQPYFGSMTIDITKSDYRAIAKYGEGGVESSRERRAVASVIQGTTAEVMRFAYMNIKEELKKIATDSYIVGSVHDSLKFIISEKDYPNIKEYINTCLNINVEGLAIPIKCEATWYYGNGKTEVIKS